MDERLITFLASTSKDPYAFVMGAFPWGEEGTRLKDELGPEPWQIKILHMVREGLPLDKAVQLAVASGHGIGKSALVAWLILWAISTLSDTRGVVTANTESQLKTKTWAELGKWYHLFIAKDSFKLTATALFQPERERTWRIDMVPWSERNTEAFAGLHNKGRRIIIIFDEGSAIADKIYEVSEGALTDKDTQIIWAVFGNPTRNSGRFKECFASGRFSRYWQTFQVDSREVSFTDKADILRKIEAYGEDSDYVRIRVKGQFPRTGEMEFFSATDVDAAMVREISSSITDPFILGVDVARYGANASVIFPRKGRDARTTPRQRFQGLNTVDLAVKVHEANSTYSADAIMVDGGGVGGGVVDNIRRMHLFCYEVQFGSRSDNAGYATGNDGERYANKRAEMYGAARAWLRTGAIPNDPELRGQLLGITYSYNAKDEIILTSKEDMMKEGKPSPDDLDALVCTFAYPISSHSRAGGEHPQKPAVEFEYDPYSPERMVA